MLPYADEPQPRARRFPVVTVAIIAVNVLVFLYELSLGQSGAERFSVRWGFSPVDFWAGRNLETLLTAIFLHGGLLHIVGNMLFLWIFGDNVEDQLGHLTYLIVYLLAGIVASIAFAVAFPDERGPLVGASGAIAGVLGGYILLYPRAMVRTLLFFGPFLTLGRVAALFLIGFWFLLQVLQSIASLYPTAPRQGEQVAFVAHVGGFIFGLIVTGAIREARDQQVSYWRGRGWWSRSFRNWLLLVVGITALVLVSQALVASNAVVAGRLLQVAIGAGIVAIALLDGIARLRGHRGLLGTGPRTNRIAAILQILAALSLIAPLAMRG